MTETEQMQFEGKEAREGCLDLADQLAQDQQYREFIWLKTYRTAMLAIGRGCRDAEYAEMWADDCLAAFDERFPRPVMKAMDQMLALQKVLAKHQEDAAEESPDV